MEGNSFSYERLCTKTRFEEEVQGNSEMAYFIILVMQCFPVGNPEISHQWFDFFYKDFIPQENIILTIASQPVISVMLGKRKLAKDFLEK